MHKRLVLLGCCVAVALGAVALKGVSPAVGAGGGTISGRIINDLNGDGVQQPNEPGLSGWRVVLNKNHQPVGGGIIFIAETLTGPDGSYKFSGLAEDAYQVLLPCDGQPIVDRIRTAPDKLHQPDFVPRFTTDVDLLVQIPAEPLRTDGEITGKIVNDANMNGNPDRREQGLAGWQVGINRESPIYFCPGEDEANLTYVTTDARGVFDIKGLVEGTYTVGGEGLIVPPGGGPRVIGIDSQSAVSTSEAPVAPPTAWIQTCPVSAQTDPTLGNTLLAASSEVKLAKGSMKATTDQCIGLLVGDGSISGDVFLDQNGNEVRDQGDSGYRPNLMALHYVTKQGLIIVNPWGPFFPPVKDGVFTYAGLAPGRYVVSAYVGWLQPSIFRSSDLTLSRGQAMTGVNLAIAPPPAVPTPAPHIVQVRPEPTLSAPNTGSGPSPAAGDASATPFALAFLGAGALTLTIRMVRRRRS